MKHLEEITDLVASYIAGFWDGEGHIGIHKGKNYPTLKVVGVSCHLPTLKYMQRYLGGHLSTKKCRPEHQQGYQLQLRLSCGEIHRFVKHIVPHLKTKAANGMLLASCLDRDWCSDSLRQVLDCYDAIKPARLTQATLGE